MRPLILLFAVLAIACVSSAAPEFVGVVASSKQTLFAIRESESAPARWLSIGAQIGEFVVFSYDAKAESLVLKKEGEQIALRLPESRVLMSRDEVVVGLQKILNVKSAKDICDLLHPKLKPLFKDVPCDSMTYSEVLEPGTRLEIREIPDEWSKALAKSLSEIESVLGVRPTYALWITVRGKVRTMTSVVQVGESWYLTPGVPQERK
jgi:hypothetical protein